MRSSHAPFLGVTMSSGVLLLGSTSAAGPLTVISVDPDPRTMTAEVTTSISVTFDRPLASESIDSASFWAFARWSGPVEGDFTISPDGRTATLIPFDPLSHGEAVMVILSHDIQAADGGSLRSAGYSWQFWTASAPATMEFEEIDVLSTRTTPGESTRAYGGIASDLNNDSFLDLTIVNEDTADLRVFLNRADGTGRFERFLQPPSPVGDRASPSEPADFNRDGFVDVCVANINDDSISVLLGNGDGTFAPHQLIGVGTDPRGIAVLDADGDGDIDIANTNATTGNLSLLLNDGDGHFGDPIDWDGGGSGEWALAAADMDEDGILDLVVGARSNQRIIINRGNGDGSFTPTASVAAGGAVWMLVCGDVNGDGHEDVVTVNSSHNNGSIILGDGMGGLAPPTTYATDPFPLATDLADLDGDGDLDWVTSSFGGDWFIFTNDGSGAFTFHQQLSAPAASSCSLPFDFDNDGDLDLALIDEIADVVLLMRNASIPCVGDIDGSGEVGFADLLALLSAWGPCRECPEDLNGDDQVGFADLLVVLSSWGPCR